MTVWETVTDWGALPVFDGPGEECPLCHGTVEQLVLDLAFDADIPAACADCGVVLAA